MISWSHYRATICIVQWVMFKLMIVLWESTGFLIQICIMDMHHGHASWHAPWTCSMETRTSIMDMKHVHAACTYKQHWHAACIRSMYNPHRHAAWRNTHALLTWTYSTNMDMRYQNGHALLTWICSMDMNMHQTCTIDLDNGHHWHGKARLVLRGSDTLLNKFPRVLMPL